MGERDTNSLDELATTAEAPAEAKPQPVLRTVAAPPPLPLVDLNYPDPTMLSVVIRDVSRWSKLSFVMEPTVNTRIQIFSSRKMAPNEAYDLFLASLAVVNLRAVQMGSVVKIVPVSIVVSA